MMRRLVPVTLTAFAVLAAASCGGDGAVSADRPSSTSSTDVVIDEELPVGTFGAGWSTVGAGIGYLDLEADGAGRFRSFVSSGAGLGPGLVDIPFSYTIDGGHITVTAEPAPCVADPSGTYRWVFDGEVIRFEADGERSGCGAGLEADRYSLGGVPVVPTEPTAEPVVVGTPVGEISWHIVYGFRERGPIVAYRDGFAAIDDRSGQVIVSPDGFDWSPIPPPPSSPALLAARSDELYVISVAPPIEVHVTTDGGETWTSLALEPPLLGSAGHLVAGPAGVLIVGDGLASDGDERASATPLWVLGADSFEHVADAPAPIRTIVAVDSGFVVASSDGVSDEPSTTWTSDDGRAWVESVDAPDGLFLNAGHGDTVYGATAVDWGVTSTDGGRTWSEPVLRPGGPHDWLAVSEVGSFSVETVLFAPPVGVVWASADQVTWERVLNPWPPPFLHQPVLNGDTILMASEIGDGDGQVIDHLNWIGVIG
ncbi:MAG: hypothetical protein S0880_05605 [Actinomycetota bacterium]|nr:hypothetical protein [Actinomycetota bacterium]